MIGDAKVGKSSFIRRYVNYKHFVDEYEPTISCTSIQHNPEIARIKYDLTIIDTPGDEQKDDDSSIIADHYKEADGFMLCFDITNKESFDNIKNKWINKINEYNTTNAAIWLIGIKTDLEDQRVVTYQQGLQYAESEDNNISSYQETENIAYNYVWVNPIKHVLIKKYFMFGDTWEKYIKVNIDAINDLIKSIKNYKGSEKEKQNLLNNLRSEVAERDIHFCYGGERGEYIESDSKLDIIDYIFRKIRKIIILQKGKKSVFDKLMECMNKNENVRCRIDFYAQEYKPWQDTLIRDNRLYSIAADQLIGIDYKIDNEFLDECISNSYPYKLWDKLSTNLTNNEKLEEIEITVNNECINDPLKVKKISDIFKCIEKSKAKLRILRLYFKDAYYPRDKEPVTFNYKSHDDPILRNVLYSSIIKCIKSKSDSIEQFWFAHYTGDYDDIDKNKQNGDLFQLFDSKFCSQLLEIPFHNLNDFELKIALARMNYQCLASFYHFLQNCPHLCSIELNTQIFIQKFDEEKDKKLAESISNNLTLSPCLRCITLSEIPTESLKYCHFTIITIIKKTNRIPNIRIG